MTKVAIVTGASQGIGAGIAKAYRDLGFTVIANSRNIEQSHDQGLVAVAGDIGQRNVAQQVVATAIARFGRIDTLINNAGVFIGKPFTEYSESDLTKIVEVNVAGFFHVTQLAIAEMLKVGSGHVVQITTTRVNQPIAGSPSALAVLTKGGLDAVTRALAIEYAKQGIRVNAVAPGVIETPMHRPEAYEKLAGLHPMGRMGKVSEIVDAIMYLEKASFVTGEILNVDGGQHAGRW